MVSTLTGLARSSRIDRKNEIGGLWASQIFSFHDVASYLGFIEFESAVYQTLRRFGKLATGCDFA